MKNARLWDWDCLAQRAIGLLSPRNFLAGGGEKWLAKVRRWQEDFRQLKEKRVAPRGSRKKK